MRRLAALLIGCVALPCPATAQVAVSLNNGAATVVFPRGRPAQVTAPSAASIASVVATADKQLADAGRVGEQTDLDAYLRAQLGAAVWIVQDDASGQTFMAGGYELPKADEDRQLTCESWLRTPKAAWVTDRRCRPLATRGGQAIEVRMIFKSGVTQVDREYAIAGHRFSLSHSDWGARPALLQGIPYSHADDSAAFFTSFKFLGGERRSPASPGG